MNSEKKALSAIKEISRKLSADNAEASKLKLLNILDKSSFSTKIAASACISLIELGEFVKVIDILQKCVQKNGESEIIYSLMGEAALRLQIPEIAEKAYTQAYRLNENDPSHLLHLAVAMEKQARPDEAIDLLASALEKFPTYAKFWDALGNWVADYRNDEESALSFLSEAVRLAPNSADIHHNMALKLYGKGEAKQYYQKALSLEPENAQIHLSYATYLLADKQFAQARKHYEYRLQLHKGTQKGLQYTHKLPRFKKGPVVGQSFVFYAEQGIGDEVFFAFVIAPIVEVAKTVHLVCDPRLLDIYRRSFPKACVYAYEDDLSSGTRIRHVPEFDDRLAEGLSVDFSCFLGSIFLHASPDLNAYQSYKGGFLVPHTELAETYSRKIKTAGRRSFGIAWRSGNLAGSRSCNYLDTDFVLALAKQMEADFFILQYECTEEEKKALSKVENIHFFEGVDLKQDIEANIAAMTNLDAVITPSTATFMLSVAIGTKTILVSPSKPWTIAGGPGNWTVFGESIDFIKYEGTESALAVKQALLG